MKLKYLIAIVIFGANLLILVLGNFARTIEEHTLMNKREKLLAKIYNFFTYVIGILLAIFLYILIRTTYGQSL